MEKLEDVQRATVGDGSGVEAAARDEADALAAQTLQGVSRIANDTSCASLAFHYFGRVLAVLVAVAEAAVPTRALDGSIGEGMAAAAAGANAAYSPLPHVYSWPLSVSAARCERGFQF